MARRDIPHHSYPVTDSTPGPTLPLLPFSPRRSRRCVRGSQASTSAGPRLPSSSHAPAPRGWLP
ncbi:MAG: hypothetical protein MZV64_19785 [Ignavibacteriales bacterium]|nr:hypothetical protein [Ignavibacteriales bacterium]